MLCVKTAMLAHSRGNLISISWAKNLSPAFSRFNVLVDYGVVYLPLLIFLYRNWLSEDILGKGVLA
jgi:hypothetical protein